MRNGYVTKRQAPQGYAAITRPLAEQLYNEGKTITLCGSNVRMFHVFQGWVFGFTANNTQIRDFQSLLNSFLHYLYPEIGRYAVFYVKKCDLSQKL